MWIVRISADLVNLPGVPVGYTSFSDDEASSVSTHESVTSASITFVEDVGLNGVLPNDPLLLWLSPMMNEERDVSSVSFCFPLFDHPILEEESLGVSISASDCDDAPLSVAFLLIS